MKREFRKLLWIAGLVAGAAGASAGNILQNPGFESGALGPWLQRCNFCGFPCGNWTGTSSDSHSGGFSAMDIGNIEIRQNFAPTPTSQITQVSYWLRHPDGGFNPGSVDFFYSDGSNFEFGATF